ncbi:50S ribosomal protein L19, chloroplastic-like isoform X2 [Panicum virgatum]|uniref:Uncharacterized protein n=1 Tax=Panicum virgatum TaxID=38727 RepID=A0A8T0VJN5_PANVG|nr:50S ribosomal protein L19, chloroplastic-like isoform X2 [Panicum virgatum]XP_039794422.1 50S ribosomal protein L19, chloroplastic-like isoform X2 [Panicum virgatum]XP_039794423.1 50S ribosomal protein L19, chloroplastic-like isoform X2 [Panicum virgatum]KAG2633846.1 hypothetical protein PVAP13_2NG248700 [Panicum virgatum]
MAFLQKVGNLVKRSTGASSSLYQAVRCMSSSKLFIGGISYGTDEHSLRDARFALSQIITGDRVPAASGFCARALPMRGFSTVGNAEVASDDEDSSSPAVAHPPRIKFKRLDKTARHIMNILNKEAVEKVRSEREIPDVQPGCIIQMRLQVPENKRRESTLKGIVIGRRNAGINTTFRLRRLVAGIGVESVFPLYSPNIKEIKILDRKKVRRAKLYYLRDRMNALKK